MINTFIAYLLKKVADLNLVLNVKNVNVKKWKEELIMFDVLSRFIKMHISLTINYIIGFNCNPDAHDFSSCLLLCSAKF